MRQFSGVSLNVVDQSLVLHMNVVYIFLDRSWFGQM